MKVLVTGGAGFIGSAVVREGLLRGHDVCIIDNFSTGYASNIPQGVTLIEGDILNGNLLYETLVDVDAVFHLAASVGNVRSIEAPLVDAQTNVMGTLTLLEAMRRRSITRIVYSSSAAIFGEPQNIPLDETHFTEPDSPYGVTKLAAEKHILCYGRIYGWHAICLRYFNVYGVNQRFDAYGNVIPIFAQRLLKNKPLKIYGDGEQTRDFVSVEDVARANWLALEHGKSGVYNIGTGVAITISSLAQLMQEIWGKAVEIENVSPRAGEVRHSRADISHAQKSFLYEPQISLESGLKSYLDWFNSYQE